MLNWSVNNQNVYYFSSFYQISNLLLRHENIAGTLHCRLTAFSVGGTPQTGSNIMLLTVHGNRHAQLQVINGMCRTVTQIMADNYTGCFLKKNW